MSVIDVSKLKYRKNVGMVLINAQGHIFAGKRIDNNTGAWQMPQGGIDEDEAPETAAFRELTEETGINPRNARLLFSTVEWLSYDIPVELIPQLWNGQFRGQKQKWFAFEFLGKDSDINIATEEPEFSEWAWKSKDDLLSSIVPFKVEVYQKVFLELGHLVK
ncbi:RNA pyrophosphohydrolase [Paracoccaceae bacterium]|nr:RNA pyrophosphohydrolase [Paracoccaceae bacterium]